MRNFITLLLITASFSGSAYASKVLSVTHNVLVRQGFSVKSCAKEIESQTAAAVIQTMEAISIISINADTLEATRVAKLRCVDTVEENGTVSTGIGSANWIVTSRSQKRILDTDQCARAALYASGSLVSNEIQKAGVDYPDHIYLSEFHVNNPGRYYSVTFKGDSTILVETRRYGSGCRVIQAGRIGLE